MDNPLYRIRFQFSYSTGTCFWPENNAARERYGYPIEPDELPLTPRTIAALNDLNVRYDASLDWDDPGGPPLWADAQWQQFYARARQVARQVRDELGATYQIDTYLP